jgi:hypothetical protein
MIVVAHQNGGVGNQLGQQGVKISRVGGADRHQLLAGVQASPYTVVAGWAGAPWFSIRTNAPQHRLEVTRDSRSRQGRPIRSR